MKLVKSDGKGPKNVHFKTPTDIAGGSLYLSLDATYISVSANKPGSEVGFKPIREQYYECIEHLKLEDMVYYVPTDPTQATFDGFIYEMQSQLATVFQATVASNHGVKALGLRSLRSKGVKRVRYVAVTSPQSVLDLPFPKDLLEVNGMVSLNDFVVEKYQLVLESLL